MNKENIIKGSFSIEILKEIMNKKSYYQLEKKYITFKCNNWSKYKESNMTKNTNEIGKEIEKINSELIAITSDSINNISGERICSFRAGRIKDFLYNALLRTEKRAREERDKEIINRLDIILTDPNDYLRGGIENLKTFINKQND